jgi:hypothetical protein
VESLEEPTADGVIQLVSDGGGLAIFGSPSDVARFLVSEGLGSSKQLDLPALGTGLRAAATTAQAGSEIAANSGRWLKLTKESAALVHKHGLTKTKTPGISHAMVGKPGAVKNWLQVEGGLGSVLTNPANLAGAAGIMAQLSMQQAMDEITDYLAKIDEKIDDLLRAQKDTVVARMIGVGLVIDDAMTKREQVGRVSEVTWSTVQGTPVTIAETQAYALRQLDALAEKIERKSKIGDLAEAVEDAKPKVREWIAILARCFQLQDAVGVLELDRVLDAAPEELDRHRVGLRSARQKRLELITRTTENLIARVDAASGMANSKVLLHPTKSPAVVQSANHVVSGVLEFRGRLGIDSGRESGEAKRWADAATEVRDKALEFGADGVDTARRLGGETLNRAKSVKGKISSGIAERARRRGGDDEGSEE